MNCIRKKLIWLVLFHFISISTVIGGDVIVSWDPNTEADLLGYKIYYGIASRTYTDVIDVGNFTSHTISGLQEGIEYFFAVTAYDTANNESDFSAEVNIVIQVTDVTPPTISSVNLNSATNLSLTYSEKVEKNSAEDLSNYQISNGVTIHSIVLDSNEKIVHLITSPHQPGTYTVTVNNVTDLALSPNMIEPNSSYIYQFIPDDTTSPMITAVQILDATHIDITFNEEIEKTSAELVQNYQINNGITILQANLDPNNRVVHLVTTSHSSGLTYTLIVNNIRDRASNPNYINPNSTQQYTYFEQDSTPPTIYSVNIRNENLVDVIFSEGVEQASAENLQNYKINNGINVLVAILDINQKTVHLSTTSHQANISYVLTVNNIVDLAQPPNVIQPNSSYDYEYQPNDNIPPQLVSAETMDETHVDVSFSEALDRESAEDESNYRIDKGIVIIEAQLDSNKTIVHLVTSTHQTGETYTITVNNIKDLAPNPNTIASNSTMQYVYVYQDREPPQIEDIQILYATYLKISFNEIVERESAEKISNYAISNGVQVLGAILDNSLKTVHLTTSTHQPDTSYTLTVNGVRDRSPNRNSINPNTTVQYKFEVSSESIVLGLSKENYKLAYLNVGDEYYVDRNYKIISIPAEMNGYLWIQTANDDRDKKDSNFLTFQLAEKAKIYIAYDSRALNYPNWLVNDYYRIGKQIGVSEYAAHLDLWERECEPGIITLGANLAEGAQGVESMYVVLIESKNSQRPGSPDDMGDPLSLGPANLFLLYQNYPNPFNAGTEIRFQLPKDVFVELTIYDILGQTVKTLTEGYKTAGHYILKWDGKDEAGSSIPSGVYFSRLIIKKEEIYQDKKRNLTIYNHVRKMIMVK